MLCPDVELQTRRLAGRLHHLFAAVFARFIVDDHLQLARLILHVVPAQAVAVEALLGVLPDASLALAVDKELALRTVGIAVDGRHLADAVSLLLL